MARIKKEVFKGLLMAALQGQPKGLSQKEIQAKTGTSSTTTYKFLQEMASDGLVIVSKVRKTFIYELAPYAAPLAIALASLRSGEKRVAKPKAAPATEPVSSKKDLEDGMVVVISGDITSRIKKTVEEKLDTTFKAMEKDLVAKADGLIEKLASSIVSEVLGRASERINAGLAGLLEAIPAEVLNEEKLPEKAFSVKVSVESKKSAEPEQKKLKVGIVGLLPIQNEALKRELANLPVEVYFWYDGPQDALKTIGKNCDAVFVHTKHGSHSVGEKLKSAGANINYVPGGKSNMRIAVERFLMVNK